MPHPQPTARAAERHAPQLGMRRCGDADADQDLVGNHTYGDGPATISATGGGSGQPVTFTPTDPSVHRVDADGGHRQQRELDGHGERDAAGGGHLHGDRPPGRRE